jgi:hypothetical protein
VLHRMGFAALYPSYREYLPSLSSFATGTRSSSFACSGDR